MKREREDKRREKGEKKWKRNIAPRAYCTLLTVIVIIRVKSQKEKQALTLNWT